MGIAVNHRPETVTQFKEIARRLALGQSVREIAANMGLQDQYVSQAYHDPQFKEILMNAEDKRDQEVYNVSGHMANVLREACSTVVDIMSDPDALPAVRLACAKEVIKQGLRQFGPPRIGSITQNNTISYEQRMLQYEQSNLGSVPALAGDIPKDYYLAQPAESDDTGDFDDDDAEYDVPVNPGGSFDLIARTLGLPPLMDTPINEGAVSTLDQPIDQPVEDKPKLRIVPSLLEEELLSQRRGSD